MIHSTSRYFQLLCCFLFIYHQLYSQNQGPLDKYISEALENNLVLKQLSLDRDIQFNLIEQSQKAWGFQSNIAASYLIAEGGRRINFPIGDIINPVYSTLNQITNTSQFPSDIPNINTQLTPNNFIDLSFSISKPLINSSLKHNIHIQKTLAELPQLALDLRKHIIKYQVKTTYYNYLKTFIAEDILNENLNLLNDLLQFNEKLVKYDKATDDKISDVQYQLALLNSEISSIKEQRNNAMGYINLLRNKPVDESLAADSSLINLITLTEDLSTLKNRATTNRIEFQQIQLSQEINQLNQRRIKDEKLPTLGATGGIGLQAEEFSFDTGGPLFTIALGLKWNIFDNGLRNKRIQALEIERAKTDLGRDLLTQQVTLEINNAIQSINSINARIAAEEEAFKSATRSMELIKTRYENEKALLIELLQAQNKWQRAKLALSLSKIDLLITFANLERITAQ